MSGYTYPSDAEFEAEWVEAHRRHRVEVGAGHWLVCRTCGTSVKLTTMDAYAVVRSLTR